MAIIIGDIHGDPAMAQAFLNYKPEAEHVALGDLVDSRDPKTTLEQELKCLDILLRSESVLLWGNHDLAYLPEQPWGCFTRFKASDAEKWAGQSTHLAERYAAQGHLVAQDVFEERYQNSRNRFKAAHAVDGWLCTHAGVSAVLAAELVDAPFGSGDPVSVAEWLNAEFYRELAISLHNNTTRYGAGPLFKIDRTRGGDDRYGGIFWYDPRWEPSRPPDPRIKQIFAHTMVEGPMKKSTWINIHIEGPGYWAYDTETDDFVILPEE